MADTSPPLRARPLSPHLQVWRFHVTMAASILTRISGAAIYAGAILVAGWALALASGESAYAAYVAVLASPLGQIVLFGMTLSLFYHLAAGVRHLGFDIGRGLDPRAAGASAWACIVFAAVASLALWAWLILGGRPA